MPTGWPVPLGETPQFLAGVLMALLAAVLLFVRFSGRMNRALALYLTLAAAREIIGSLDDPIAAPRLTSWVFHTIPWFDIALPFAALHLAQRCREHMTGRPGPRGLGVGLLAGALVAEAAYLFAAPGGTGAYPSYVSSPFILAYAGLPLVLSLIAAHLAFGSRTPLETRQIEALRVAAVAFAAHAAFAPAVGFRYFYLIAGIQPFYLATMMLTLLPVLCTIGLLWRGGRRAPLFLIAVLAAGAGYIALAASVGVPETAFAVFEGCLRLVLPGLLGYGILRHQLLGLDVKVRWTISKTTLAAAFIGVFFVASEAAQEFFGSAFGSQYYGIIAAGALVFVLSPLSRAADRLAARALPASSADMAAGRDEAEPAYRAALRAALRDGTIRRSEEHHLAELAVHLGLDPKRTLELREQVEAEHEEAKPPLRRPSTSRPRRGNRSS